MKKILAIPFFFNLFNRLIGEKNGRTFFVKKYIQPYSGMKILDIGCGIGSIVPYLGDVDYEGYDASQVYIDHATELYKENRNAKFYCELVESSNLREKNYYDVVLASGLIHHLSVESCRTLFQTAHDALKPGGKFISIDNVLVPEQSWMARKIILQDRGEYIRQESEYTSLFSDLFPNTRFDIHHDILRIPYTHIIAIAVK